jgi:hypothetical protein
LSFSASIIDVSKHGSVQEPADLVAFAVPDGQQRQLLRSPAADLEAARLPAGA